MKRKIVLGLGMMALCGGLVMAAPFEPMMQAGDGADALSVKTPGSRSFDGAQAAQAYPYGSAFKTSGKGGATLVLSAGNQVELAAGTMCSIGEGAMNASRKTLTLDSGRVEVKLEEGFSGANAFKVVTPVAAYEAQGGTFTIETMSENDMDVADIMVESGSVKAYGPNFGLPSLDKNDRVSISTARDGSYTLIETVQGAFSLEAKDAAGNPKSVEMEEGSIVKIWRRTSETGKTLIVTILITAPDGALQEAITYTEEIPETEMAEGDMPPAGQEVPTSDQATPTTLPGDLLLLTTTPTTTTTTSTTFPSPTPIGLR